MNNIYKMHNESFVKPMIQLETARDLTDYLQYNEGALLLTDKHLELNAMLTNDDTVLGSIRWSKQSNCPTFEGNCLLYIIKETGCDTEHYIVVDEFEDCMVITARFKGSILYNKTQKILQREGK